MQTIAPAWRCDSARAAVLAGLEFDEPLFERLRALRKQLADEQHAPAYIVLSDSTRAEMAARRPANQEALLEVGGVGRSKVQCSRDAFLEVAAGSGGESDAQRAFV